MNIIASATSLMNTLIPFVAALLVLPIIIAFFVWIIMLLAKSAGAKTAGKILLWLVIIFVLAIVLWGLLNILSASFGSAV